MLIWKDNNEHLVLTELMSLAPEKIAFTSSERASKTSCYWLFVWGLGFFWPTKIICCIAAAIRPRERSVIIRIKAENNEV